MRVASLGSGSGGNATLVEGADTRLLIDCGFGPRVTQRRLRALGVEPASLDAAEPFQVVIDDGRRRFGVLTDTGVCTPHMVERLAACDGLLLECNHDPAMLRAGPYPRWLQARVSGRHGHAVYGVARKRSPGTGPGLRTTSTGVTVRTLSLLVAAPPRHRRRW